MTSATAPKVVRTRRYVSAPPGAYPAPEPPRRASPPAEAEVREPDAAADELDQQLGAVVRAEPVASGPVASGPVTSEPVAPAPPAAAPVADPIEPSVPDAPPPAAQPLEGASIPVAREDGAAEPAPLRARRTREAPSSSAPRRLGIFVGCILGGLLGAIAGAAYVASRREPDFTQWPTLLRQPDSLLEIAADPLIGGPAAAIVVVCVLLGGLIGTRRRRRSRRA